MSVKTEIVSPAGSLEKLIFAVKYGADSVYFGGDEFNLLVKAGNFTGEEIRTGIAFCKSNNVKTTFLMNAFLHETDVDAAFTFAETIKGFGFDSVMVSDPGMFLILKQAGIEADFHLSTQMSTLNSWSVKFWLDAGFKRIVLAREATVEEIKMIKRNTGADIEVFAHGALCIAYSGRCLLSRYLQGGDANRGDCSQPCRWKYSLVEEKRAGDYIPVYEHEKGTEIISSKDLCLVERLEEYIDAGVNAFKIEGRMKSVYHTANTTRIYKHAALNAGTDRFREFLPFWLEELNLISHRPYTTDLFNEFGKMGYDGIPYINRALFVAYRSDDGGSSDEVTIRTFNPIYRDEVLDGIYPINERIIDCQYRVLRIIHEDSDIDMGRPNSTYRVLFDKPVHRDAIFRRRL